MRIACINHAARTLKAAARNRSGGSGGIPGIFLQELPGCSYSLKSDRIHKNFPFYEIVSVVVVTSGLLSAI